MARPRKEVEYPKIKVVKCTHCKIVYPVDPSCAYATCGACGAEIYRRKTIKKGKEL